jgi:hypothetical protein
MPGTHHVNATNYKILVSFYQVLHHVAVKICLPAFTAARTRRSTPRPPLDSVIIQGMGVLAAKIVLAPAFVVGASLAARYGSGVGGLVGGLPVVAGPILLVFALSHGRAFAASASAATLLGIVSLSAFVVVYARLAASAHWSASLPSGWLAFFALTAALSAFSVPAGVALGCMLAAVGFALLALPRVQEERADAPRPPRWDLPLRAISALALVLALTALAGQLGSKLSGLLAPFPVVASVLAVFTHGLRGQLEVVRIMRGFLTGLVAYGLFCFILAESLRTLPIAAGFALAATAALTTQAIALLLSRRRLGVDAVAVSAKLSDLDPAEAAEPL